MLVVLVQQPQLSRLDISPRSLYRYSVLSVPIDDRRPAREARVLIDASVYQITN